MGFVCSIVFQLWQIEMYDQHLCHVSGCDHAYRITKCKHLWVVGLRLEGNLHINMPVSLCYKSLPNNRQKNYFKHKKP